MHILCKKWHRTLNRDAVMSLKKRKKALKRPKGVNTAKFLAVCLILSGLGFEFGSYLRHEFSASIQYLLGASDIKPIDESDLTGHKDNASTVPEPTPRVKNLN